ncbi:hypothetical protein M3197_11780 [Sporosarcina aquimarina]|uniref:hypothetical protein n=1 Tax=Sporosarcina aquimarina TaxID=114975 RepID=UPI00203E1A4A|nr:hypothetical protein [Sporosarcina aquimarina]MCM3758143.1 hypothetical protein [Sporosarcina aquimarina]
MAGWLLSRREDTSPINRSALNQSNLLILDLLVETNDIGHQFSLVKGLIIGIASLFLYFSFGKVACRIQWIF